MSHRVGEIDEVKGPSRENALDAWRQMQMRHAEARTKNNSTNTALNDRSNSNELIQDGTVHDASTAGAGGAHAAIVQAQGASGSGGQNSGNFSGQGQRDTQQLSDIARAREASGGLKAAVQVSFADMDQDTIRVNQLRNSLIQQMDSRLGIRLNADDIRGMDAPALQEAIKAMAQQVRPTASNDDSLNSFVQLVDAVSPDFFEAVSVEELQQQAQ
ncbi:MAG: hypothetical protein IGS03_18715 [Candidatus Sericytochromatia bacterium]|nr:hypothetical protein [Candidatus Sericytochromatia bacterium]